MTTGLWVLFWVLVSLVIIGILLWAANRKPVKQEDKLCIHADSGTGDIYPKNGLDYLNHIYPVTGEYPPPLTGIQKEAMEREFTAGSTAAPEVKFERVGLREVDTRTPTLKELAKSVFNDGNAKPRRPSVKSKTPVVKKKAPAKKDKPVAKKKAKKKV